MLASDYVCSHCATGGLPPDVARSFAAGREMGRLMAGLNWAATPIGCPHGWPPALRTAVDVCLRSRFPILIWWGRSW